MFGSSEGKMVVEDEDPFAWQKRKSKRKRIGEEGYDSDDSDMEDLKGFAGEWFISQSWELGESGALSCVARCCTQVVKNVTIYVYRIQCSCIKEAGLTLILTKGRAGKSRLHCREACDSNDSDMEDLQGSAGELFLAILELGHRKQECQEFRDYSQDD